MFFRTMQWLNGSPWSLSGDIRGPFSPPQKTQRVTLTTITFICVAFMSMVFIAVPVEDTATDIEYVFFYLNFVMAVLVTLSMWWRRKKPLLIFSFNAVVVTVFPLSPFGVLVPLIWVIACAPQTIVLLTIVVAGLATGIALYRDYVRDVPQSLFTIEEAGVMTQLSHESYIVMGITFLIVPVLLGIRRRHQKTAINVPLTPRAHAHGHALAPVRMNAPNAHTVPMPMPMPVQQVRQNYQHNYQRGQQPIQPQPSQRQAPNRPEGHTSAVPVQDPKRQEELSRQQERDLIAREMHDTVAHQLSLVSLQASALEVTSSDPNVPESARAMRLSVNRALDEMRGLISSLRDSKDGGYTGVTPTLADLDMLVREAQESGAPVQPEIRIQDGDKASHSLTNAVYRITQEALTNAIRYGLESPIVMRVLGAPGLGITIDVINEISESAKICSQGSQAGIPGMQERAETLGGSVTTSEIGRVFILQARLPWNNEN
ncbi:sensor histidine kinase [Timonella sp. A28]|uniref:sensor histidine kinase n=1 Tax=Timonella sp. A28 TaxID=3442640 RepID=UPI003EBC814C